MNEEKRIRKEFQIWKACAKADQREALEYVVFWNGYAYATDSHILARVETSLLTGLEPDEVSLLNGYAIHAKAIKTMASFDNISVDEGPAFLCRIKHNDIRFELCKKEDIEAPNYEEVLKEEGEHHPIEKIGVESEFLSRLTAAIGSSRVKMEFFTESSKIIVKPVNEILPVKGLIMPIMTTGSLDFE